MQNAKNQLGVLNAPTRKTAGLAVSDIYKAYQPNMPSENEDLRLLAQVLEIYPRKFTLSYLQLIVLGKWTEELLQRCFEGEQPPNFSEAEYLSLQRLLPEAPPPGKSHDFDFVDLFAGIGGMRKGFEQAGGRCVFTSEWNPFALRTYRANYYSDARVHKFNEDIRDVTLSTRTDIPDEEAHHFINETVPDHDILLAGFPCQPFSVTDVASIDFPGRDALEWHPQGTLFFDIARIIAAKRPVAFVLENVKNLKSHDRGTTFAVIMAALDELGYWVADADANGDPDPKIIDGAHFVPQHRERIVLVGFRKDLGVHEGFTLKDISKLYPLTKPTLGDILDKEVDQRYTLTPKLWEYLFNYSVKHKQNGNGFGYGLVGPNAVTRTLSARYHKDGSEILVDRGLDPALGLCHEKNMANRPRRLTPRECARLMGFDGPGESNFRIPVSDTQAYKQFGNSVVVPVFAAVARLMKERVMAGKNILASPQHRYEDGFEHTFQTIDQLSAFLGALGAERAVIKQLPKNANDKNQIRLAPDFGVLFDDFDLTLSERGESTSLTKERSAPGTRIPEAVFNDFSWLRNDGALVPAKQIKAIIYTQYPEARLSGLQAVDGTMPVSLSVAYTKRYSDARRVLILARLPLGKCIGIVCVDPAPVFFEGLAGLPGIRGAAACKRLQIDTGNRYRLEQMLAEVLGRPLRGCRLDANGQTLPFSGTQVCGYTLEHALGIIPNSNKDGDLFGIELKTHTQLKVTLFTPEPDGGLYADDFAAFMKTYGYRDADGDYRVTGIHRANELCGKSGLTLRVREQRLGSDGTIQVFSYDPTTPLTPKLDSIDVALIAADGTVAASWSLQRLMNCWGAKHNEVVYVPATKVANPNATECAEGYEHHVTLGQTVIWCRDTTAERLLQAIEDGVIYLDPAPKLHATDASKNKRRAQWRVNDITKAVYALYSVVEMKTIAGGPGFAARKAA